MGSNHWRSSRRCQNRTFFCIFLKFDFLLSATADHVEKSWENSARKIRRLTEFVIFVLCFYLINDLWLWRRINLVINSERRMFHDASTWHWRQIFPCYRVCNTVCNYMHDLSSSYVQHTNYTSRRIRRRNDENSPTKFPVTAQVSSVRRRREKNLENSLEWIIS